MDSGGEALRVLERAALPTSSTRRCAKPHANHAARPPGNSLEELEIDPALCQPSCLAGYVAVSRRAGLVERVAGASIELGCRDDGVRCRACGNRSRRGRALVGASRFR